MRQAFAFGFDAAILVFISMAISHVLAAAVQVMALSTVRLIRGLGYTVAIVTVGASVWMMIGAVRSALSLPHVALAVVLWMIPGYAVLEAIQRAMTARQMMREARAADWPEAV